MTSFRLTQFWQGVKTGLQCILDMHSACTWPYVTFIVLLWSVTACYVIFGFYMVKAMEISKHLKKSNAACFYAPIVSKLLIVDQMWKQHEEGNYITIILTPHLSKLIKYWLFYGASKVKSTQFHCCSKSYWDYWPYWLASQWARNIYGGGFEPLISSCWFFLRNPILLFFNLIYQCAEI